MCWSRDGDWDVGSCDGGISNGRRVSDIDGDWGTNVWSRDVNVLMGDPYRFTDLWRSWNCERRLSDSDAWLANVDSGLSDCWGSNVNA